MATLFHDGIVDAPERDPRVDDLAALFRTQDCRRPAAAVNLAATTWPELVRALAQCEDTDPFIAWANEALSDERQALLTVHREELAASFLYESELDWTDHRLRAIEQLFADLFWRPTDLERQVANAGLPAAAVLTRDNAQVQWRALLNTAARMGAMRRLIRIIRTDPDFAGQADRLTCLLDEPRYGSFAGRLAHSVLSFANPTMELPPWLGRIPLVIAAVLFGQVCLATASIIARHGLDGLTVMSHLPLVWTLNWVAAGPVLVSAIALVSGAPVSQLITDTSHLLARWPRLGTVIGLQAWALFAMLAYGAGTYAEVAYEGVVCTIEQKVTVFDWDTRTCSWVEPDNDKCIKEMYEHVCDTSPCTRVSFGAHQLERGYFEVLGSLSALTLATIGTCAWLAGGTFRMIAAVWRRDESWWWWGTRNHGWRAWFTHTRWGLVWIPLLMVLLVLWHDRKVRYLNAEAAEPTAAMTASACPWKVPEKVSPRTAPVDP